MLYAIITGIDSYTQSSINLSHIYIIMKKHLVKIASEAIITLAVLCSLTSCGTLSNMSDQDAFFVGYGAGTLLHYIIDN